MVHLIVADVNIFQGNRLDLYWVTGNPVTGKWTAAWLIDRRGFTSWSHPWSAAWKDRVNVLWSWCDVSVNKGAPGMGIFHLQWSPVGFGRKVRVVKGVPETWDAAIDARTGRLLLVYADNQNVYLTSRSEGGVWTQPAVLQPGLQNVYGVSVKSGINGEFIVRANSEPREWLVRLR